MVSPSESLFTLQNNNPLGQTCESSRIGQYEHSNFSEKLEDIPLLGDFYPDLACQQQMDDRQIHSQVYTQDEGEEDEPELHE